MDKNIKSASTQEDPFRDEFHRLLGRLIHSIARFDFTVGLQLNWLGPHCQQDVSGLLSARQAKLGERLKKLRTLIMNVYESAGPAAPAEFSVWFDKADQARVLRNDYAYGRWDVPGKHRFKPPGRMIDAEPLLAFIPLHWDMPPDRADDSIYRTCTRSATSLGSCRYFIASAFRATKAASACRIVSVEMPAPSGLWKRTVWVANQSLTIPA